MATENKNLCADIVGMKEWVSKEDGPTCRPCLLAPVAQWYRDELQERGITDLAQEIEQAADQLDHIGLAETLDNIKGKVEPEVKNRLLEFDCLAQTYKPPDESE